MSGGSRVARLKSGQAWSAFWMMTVSLSCAPAQHRATPPSNAASTEGGSGPVVAVDPSSDSSGSKPRCKTESDRCRLLLSVVDLLDSGRTEEAFVLLKKTRSEASRDEEQGINLELELLILEGRAQLELGPLAYGEGGDEARRALTILRRALEVQGDSESARFQMARAHLALGEANEAFQLLSDLDAASSDDPEAQAALGITYIALGRSEQSLAPLIRASELDPEEVERWIVLGTAYFLCGDPRSAEGAYRRALTLSSNSARAHGDLGVLLAAEGRVDEAKNHLLRACSLSPSHATYWSNLAYVEHLMGDQEGAREHVERSLTLDPLLASAWLNLGLIQVAKQDLEGARTSFLKAQSIDPSDPRPQNNLKDLSEIESKSAPPSP